jgi:hypothetical protein
LPTERSPASQPTTNNAKLCDELQEYMSKESSACDIHSWTHEKETSNALLYMGIMENADPHPSDTFEVTLRGEKAIQALDAKK